MIKIDYNARTYVCPFCGHAQAYYGSSGSELVGLNNHNPNIVLRNEEEGRSSLIIKWFTCSNSECGRTCITAVNRYSKEQHDIYPRYSYIAFPDYIPQQLRCDYQEACSIIDASPKAAATLLRRCLQGMICDFWKINNGNLAGAISELQGKVPLSQWNAIDGLRRIGNIGAHMEKDVNLIVEVSSVEATALCRLVELLMEKWYVAKHDEEMLLATIKGIADQKTIERQSKRQ